VQYDVLDANLKKSWDIVVKTLKHFHKNRFSEQLVTGVKQFYRRKHNEALRFTSDYPYQLLNQSPFTTPALFSRAEKQQLVERSTSAQMTDVFRNIFPMDQSVAVYKGPRQRDLKW
jgi:hypothetical protein